MADSTSAQALDTVPDVNMIAGYVNGKWPSAKQVTRKDVPLITISIDAVTFADVYDVESGDLTPQDVPRALQTNPDGIIYSSRASWDDVKRVLDTARPNMPYPPWWAAVPGYNALYPGSIATQYMQRNGCDISIVSSMWKIPSVHTNTTGEGYPMFILDTSNGREYVRAPGAKTFIYVGLGSDSIALTSKYGAPIPLSHDLVTALLSA